MSKFKKRVEKLSRYTQNALIVGEGFGHIDEILEIFNNVFVVGTSLPDKKSKKLIYKESIDSLAKLTNINTIFFDLQKIHLLYDLKFFWQNNNSVIMIEGNDPIEREFSKPLYDTGWRCTSLQSFFHVWEKLQ